MAQVGGIRRIVVIGGVAIVDDKGPIKLRRQVRRMIALLVAAEENGVNDESLAEELWDENPPRNWNAALRNAASEARLILGSKNTITIDNGRYTLNLDTDRVDAWAFLDKTTTPSLNPETVRALIHFRPFEGLEPTRLIRRMTVDLQARRVGILDYLTPDHHVVPVGLLSELSEQAIANPFDIPMTEAVAGLLSRFSEFDRLTKLLDQLDEDLAQDLTTGLSPTLSRLRDDAASQSKPTAASEPTTKKREPLPAYFARHRDEPMSSLARAHAEAIESELSDSPSGSILILTGPAGIGKTRFATELAANLHQGGAHIAVGGGIDGATAKYAPLLSCFPEFRSWYSAAGAVDEADTWAAFDEALESTEPERPLWLFVDDAHYLETATFRLLEFTMRSERSRLTRIVVLGRDTDGTKDWIDFQTRCLSIDQDATRQIPPLIIDDTVELIGWKHPSSAAHTRLHAATEIQAASGGSPLVSKVLIETLTGDSLQLGRPGTTSTGKVLADRIRMLDEDQQRAAGAASLLGPSFTNVQLASLLGWTTELSDRVLDRLVFSDVVDDSEVPDHYCFAHDTYRDAASSVTPRRLLRQWHQLLLDQSTDTVQSARHALGAVPLVEPTIAAKYALSAAHSAFETGLARQCLEMLSEAEAHLGSLDLESEALRARALGRIVAVEASAASRQRAIDLARSSRSGDAALTATLECLTHVEPLDRYEGFLEELISYTDIPLSPSKRFDCWIAIARIGSLVGERDVATEANRQTSLLADTSDRRAAAIHSDWFVRSPEAPHESWRRQLQAHAGPDASPAQNRQLSQAVAIEHVREGDFKQAAAWNQNFLELAKTTKEPLREWHALLFNATMRAVQGDWDAHESAADAAASMGFLHDIPGAAAARTGQAFVAALGQNRVGPWLESFTEAAPDVNGSDLGESAIARSFFEIGLVDEAAEVATRLLERVLEIRNLDTLPIIGTIAPILAGLGPSSLLDRALEFALSHQGRWIVIGAGVGVIGPADQTIAVLQRDDKSLISLRSALPKKGPWTGLLDRDIVRTGDQHQSRNC